MGLQACQTVIATRPSLITDLARAATEAGLLLRACIEDRVELLHLLSRFEPDVLIVDASLGARHAGVGLVAGDEVGQRTTTILIDEEVDADLLSRLQRVEVDGFLVSPVTQAQFEATIFTALSVRHSRQSPELDHLQQATAVLQRIARELAGVRHLVPSVPVGPALRPVPELETLSPREWQVLRGLVSHRRVPTLARELGISPHTVRNHLKSIFAKLSVHSQAELLEKIIDHSSLSPSFEP